MLSLGVGGEPVRNSVLQGGNLAAALQRLHAKLPVASTSGDGMVVAVVAHRVKGEVAFSFTFSVCVANVAGVLFVLHPDRLEERSITQAVEGRGDAELKSELLDVDVAAGVYLVVGVLVRAEVEGAPVYLGLFIELSKEDGTLHGRVEGGDEQPMVAARIGPRHGARSVAADAVGHQPLFLEGFIPVYAAFTRDSDHGFADDRRRRTIDWSLQYA